jgi:5,10-methylenetetrahydromethanopterin reductase
VRIAINVGGHVVGSPSAPWEIVEQARDAEAEGFAAAWTVHFSRGLDALSTLAVAGTVTDRVDLGVGIVPTYPRHPLALAQQAATTQVFCGGRLTLGVGVSHRPVIEGLHGIPFTSPAAHMREYLSVLGPLLRGEDVSFHGSFYEVEGGFEVLGSIPVPVLVGALSPRMVRTAGELADGVVTWLAGRRTLAETIVPALRDAAASAGRAEPRVVAGLPVAVTDDVDLARRATEETFGRYAGMDNYRQVLEREGVTSVPELAIVGTEEQVEKQLRRYAEIGVTELWPVVFPVGENQQDAEAGTRRTRALLTRLAAEL